MQTVDGARTIKQLGKENYFIDKYNNVIKDKIKTSKSLALYYAFYANIFSFVMNTMPFATILLSIYFIMNGNMTVGDAVGILSIAASLTEPVTQFGEILNAKRISKAMIDKNKIFLDESIPERNLEHSAFNELTFDSKSYSFGEREILKDLNFKLNKGGVYSVVGESGTGDSDIMMTDTINSFKSKFKGFHKTFKQDDLGLSLSSFLLN